MSGSDDGESEEGEEIIESQPQVVVENLGSSNLEMLEATMLQKEAAKADAESRGVTNIGAEADSIDAEDCKKVDMVVSMVMCESPNTTLLLRLCTLLIGIYTYMCTYTCGMPTSSTITTTKLHGDVSAYIVCMEKGAWYAVRSMDAFAHALGWVMVMCMAALAVVFALSPSGMAAM
ncbi:hypothetical protein EON63_11320 [archaeon]|nr:MAG: hypothetical protein EON63_11320 [archaeon]